MEKMKISDRAKIFLPFDALKGFREALKEKEKIKVDKKLLSNYQKEEIMKVLKELKKGDLVKIEYYSEEDNDYLILEGILTKIGIDEKMIRIVKKDILMENIYKIKILENDIINL